MESSYLDFERVVRALLEANSRRYVFNLIPPSDRDGGLDFVLESTGIATGIEVKYYRTRRAQMSLLVNAARRLRDACERMPSITQGMLIVSCVVPLEMKQALEQRFNVSIVDWHGLSKWASAAPHLRDQLNALVEPDIDEQAVTDLDLTTDEWPSRPLEGPVEPVDKRGTELCEALKAIPRGKPGWAQYERTCEEILKYLFPNDLAGWHKQRRTDDGLNRFDYICRIRPTTEFWEFLLQHLDSRYVLFEFKMLIST